MPVAPYPVTGHHRKESAPILLLSAHQILISINKSPAGKPCSAVCTRKEGADGPVLADFKEKSASKYLSCTNVLACPGWDASLCLVQAAAKGLEQVAQPGRGKQSGMSQSALEAAGRVLEDIHLPQSCSVKAEYLSYKKTVKGGIKERQPHALQALLSTGTFLAWLVHQREGPHPRDCGPGAWGKSCCCR